MNSASPTASLWGISKELFFTILSRPEVCFTIAASLVRVTIQLSNISLSYLTKEKKRRKKKREICFAGHRINTCGSFPASVPQKVSGFASLGHVYEYFPDIVFNSCACTWMCMYMYARMHRACSWTSCPGTIKFHPRLLWDHYHRWQQSQFLSVPTV